MRYFDKALAIDPKHEDALTHKGIALDYLGNYTEAMRYFDNALAVAIDPHAVDAFTSKGLALEVPRKLYSGYIVL